MNAPLCPRCGYDQTGLIATWLASCPLEFVCTECGACIPAAWLFEPGPRWSIEHARRRFVMRWALTTLVALLPTTLWRGLRPNDKAPPYRLLWMAIAWLGLLHAVSALSLVVSAALMTGAGVGGPFGEGPAVTLRTLGWPYDQYFTVPTGPGSTFSDPVYGFVEIAALPHLMMAGVLLLTAPSVRCAGRRHLVRALVYSLPSACAWSSWVCSISRPPWSWTASP
ncbi:MAG: hypothetical protein IT437_10715 [Phycisphaerales bacterium]|nr:hypothetical protein [Phycisphaerales bacterium]